MILTNFVNLDANKKKNAPIYFYHFLITLRPNHKEL